MTRWLTEETAAAFIGRTCFTTGPSRRIGIELEWLVNPFGGRVTAGPLPFASLITQEPGGQIELSSQPAADLVSCITAVEADQTSLQADLAAQGRTLWGGGFDAIREPVRLLEHPRYQAMEAYFDREGQWGRMMMCCTASIQVNVDAGDDESGLLRRWNLAHRIGPILVAAFANSPLLDGRPSGWMSTRQAIWSRLDPDRTRSMSDTDDPRNGFAQYALDALVMCVRREPPAPWTAPPGLTMRSWVRGGLDGRRPTEDDLRYHLSTLFPPVRPRGWLELRMIDQQEGDGWIVPAVVAATVLDDPTCAEAAHEATTALCSGGAQPPWPAWMNAARFGLADPVLHTAARACFAAVADALQRTDAPQRLRGALAAFRQRYVEQGRCPADDRLDRTLAAMPVPLATEAPS